MACPGGSHMPASASSGSGVSAAQNASASPVPAPAGAARPTVAASPGIPATNPIQQVLSEKQLLLLCIW